MKFKIFSTLLMAMLIISCGQSEKETESKSIEQIHSEQGIPVKVKAMEKQPYKKELNYNSTLTANRQANISAEMGGNIERIHVEVGEQVRADQLIMEFDKDAPSAQYEQAKSAYELSKKTHERMKNLYETSGVSKQKLDQAETKYLVDKANWETVRNMVKVVTPISGLVTAVNARETDNMGRQAVLATVSQMDKLKTVVWATEEEEPQICKGMPVSAIWQGNHIDGEVAEVAISMDSRHNGFRVDVVFDNPDHLINPGVIAEVNIEIYKKTEAYVLQRKTVNEDDKGKYVYVVDNNRAKKRYVSIGQEDDFLEISAGLESGEQVITEGLHLVEPDAKVMVVN